MMLRMMRGPRTGRPSVLARVLSLLVVLGLVAITAPVVGPPVVASLQWLAGLL
ncbi:hypothetical protein ACPPVT_01235 [Angustibacter sp. McL0619]|uniref:hypothetical protein n=1 Tax=Angustibacter sp. McL0619 TaxID=3415676 RepID=UPI003CEFAFF7